MFYHLLNLFMGVSDTSAHLFYLTFSALTAIFTRMKDIFDMDKKSLKQLRDFFNKSPKEFSRATAGVLNSLAFSTRKYDIENIAQGMTVRNPKFVARMLKVTKTPPRSDIRKQQSSASSLRTADFTGWEEQQTGKRQTRTRAATTEGRGGSIKNTIRPRFRMRKNNKFYRPSQFKTRTEQGSFQFMMRVLATRGGGEFILSKQYGRMSPGLYSFRNHQVRKVQSTDNIKQPSRYKWRDHSIRNLQSRNDIRDIWSRELDRVMSKNIK